MRFITKKHEKFPKMQKTSTTSEIPSNLFLKIWKIPRMFPHELDCHSSKNIFKTFATFLKTFGTISPNSNLKGTISSKYLGKLNNS